MITSINILMREVVPICLSSSAKEYLFASSNVSRSILICLSIGASCSSGFLYLTISCCGPIYFMTGKYSPIFNKVLTSILPVFSFLVGIWYKSFPTCFSTVLSPSPFTGTLSKETNLCIVQIVSSWHVLSLPIV